MNKKEFLVSLRRRMKAEKLSQLLLAEFLSIDQGHLSKILKGQFKRETETIKKLAKFSDYKLDKKVDPTKSKPLMNAITFAWDGSKRAKRRYQR